MPGAATVSDVFVPREPSEDELAVLRELARGPQPRALRAAIVLQAVEGRQNTDIARRLGVSRQTVVTWRKRYAAEGASGLEDRPITGRPGLVDEGDVITETLLARTDQRSTRALARRLGCSHTAIAAARRHWKLGRDDAICAVPPLNPALGDGEVWVVGVYHDPQHTLVLLALRPSADSATSASTIEAPVDALAVVTSAFATAVAESIAPSRTDTDRAAAFLAAARRMHPRVPLHVVALRARAGAGLEAQCIRKHMTLHQRPERTGTVSFLRAVLALDASRHRSSSARVLLDLATALGGPAPVRWIREPLPVVADEDPSAIGAAARGAGGGVNQMGLGSFNECVVIETIRLAGTITRGEIAERTRLTQQSVSRISRSLLDRGLLVEERKEHVSVGKPRGRVRLRDDAAHALGIHIDPGVLTAVLVDLSGRTVARRVERITPAQRPAAVVAQIASLGEKVLHSAGRPLRQDGFLGVGVAVPGPVDTISGTVLDPPLMSVLRDIPLRALLEQHYTFPVLVEKDSTAAAVGERWIGRDRRARDFVYLYLGTGVGTGLILNGDIYRGLTANAGEFGQLCAVVLDRFEPEGHPEVLPECNPARHVLAAPRLAAAPTVRDAARAIGRGALATVDLLDVGLVVVGGPYCTGRAADVYLSEIERAVNAYPTARRLRRVHVERSVSTHEAAAVGAASTLFHAAFTPKLSKRQ